VAPRLQRGHEHLLLAGRDPPEHRVVLHRVGQGRVGHAAGIDGVGGAVDPQLAGDGADGCRAVPGDHFDGDVLLGEIRQGPGRFLAQPLAQHQQGDRLDR
jgi:hypothetical protein